MFRCKHKSFADTKTFYADLWSSTPASLCRDKAKEPFQYIAILDWLKTSETVSLLKVIQDDIIARLSDAASEQTTPNKELYDLLTAVMVGRVHGIETVLASYKNAVGKDPLTVATVLKAMNVEVGPALLPKKRMREKPTGSDQRIATPVSKLRRMFSDKGLPASLLPGNDTSGGTDDVNMVAIASYIAMVIALTSMGKLAADIRGTKMIVHFDNNNRATGACGSHKKAKYAKENRKRLLDKKKAMFRKVDEFNILVKSYNKCKRYWNILRKRTKSLPKSPDSEGGVKNITTDQVRNL